MQSTSHITIVGAILKPLNLCHVTTYADANTVVCVCGTILSMAA